ncbi:hypothetical protein MKW98_019073 [Papaver atlanticum]|uniref:Uncharacterized protein n=1 Tax=Papaver atlanticum TaxID=357466 RepID=A0AAD4TIY3_9MAGN|nr:hypothetical protein MKW98_019073 [Papaver atlanticum]
MLRYYWISKCYVSEGFILILISLPPSRRFFFFQHQHMIRQADNMCTIFMLMVVIFLVKGHYGSFVLMLVHQSLFYERIPDGVHKPKAHMDTENEEEVEDDEKCLGADAVTMIFGPDRKGYIRGTGAGVSKTQILAAAFMKAKLQEVKVNVRKEKQKMKRWKLVGC